ncbi:MAG: carbohydrate binding family 9 domain-containing protein [Candidatus Neomarinimicrobiota bacterium]|nr:carbohydrate binding family 9 domain-containing protein [Candidatus Neomarinimicrobiota bacterium]
MFLSIAWSILFPQSNTDSEKRAIITKQISENKIEIDGLLNEPEWKMVLPAKDFIQRDPIQGSPATEKTEVYVIHDKENLYIGAILFDSNPDGILAYQKRRDQSLRTDDRFMWILDTFLDGRTGYFFEVNPAGLLGDGLIIGGDSYWGINKDWNGIWDARVVVIPEGWSVEVVIPFRTLNFDPNLDTWGINFQRTVRRKNEDMKWEGFERNKKITQPIHAGYLKGLKNLTQGNGLEFKPYFSLKNQEMNMVKDNFNDIGFDVSINITSGLKASLTYNTDFAEAEVDQRRVNLTRFPLRYAEKRGFFLEGAGVYSFSPRNDVTPFFSRRIGLSDGEQIPINYGGRLSGQIGNYEIGVIQAQTNSKGDIAGENFTVARVKRAFFKQSYFGLVYTDRSSRTMEPDSNELDQSLFGADLELKTSEFMGDKNLQFQTFFVHHTAPYSEPELSISDLSVRGFRITYPNDIFRSHVSYREFGNNYNPAVGFGRRNGFKRIQPSFSYHPRPERYDFIRQVEFGIQYEFMTDLENKMLKKQTTITPFNIRFESQDQLSAKIVSLIEYLDKPFTIYEDITIPIEEYSSEELQVKFETSEKRMLSTEFEYQTGDFWNGQKQTIKTQISVKPFSGFNIQTEYEKNTVKLSGKSFNTELYNFELGIYPTPRTAIFSNLQYDNVSDALGLFAKLQHTIRPGSDFYLVYTHNWISLSDQIFDFDLMTVSKVSSLKINYSLRF